MASFLVGGGAVRGAAKLTGANMLLGAAAQGTAGYEDALAMGAGQAARYTAFFLNAGMGVSEAIPIDRFFGRLNRATGGRVARLLADTGAQTLDEFMQELVVSLGHDAIARAIYHPEREILSADNLMEGAVGGLTGAGTRVTAGLPGGTISRDAVLEKQHSTVPDSASRSGVRSGNWPKSDVRIDRQAVIKQVDETSCGYACGAMLLRSLGVDIDPDAIGRGTVTYRNEPGNLGGVLNDLNLTPDKDWNAGFAQDTEFALKVLLRPSQGSWVADMGQGTPMTHSVVVDGLSPDGNLRIRDPWDQTIYTMTQEDFLNHWTGGFVAASSR